MSWPSPTQSWLKDQVPVPSPLCSQGMVNRSPPPRGGTAPGLCERPGALHGLRDLGSTLVGVPLLAKANEGKVGPVSTGLSARVSRAGVGGGGVLGKDTGKSRK